MRPLKSLAFVVTICALVAVSAGNAAKPGKTYVVGVLTVPGVDTGLILKNGKSVTVTATGSVCPNVGYCVTPDGDPSADTTQSLFGGFVLPGAPGWGLVGRVGDGPWMQVGSGPTTLTGSGDLVFAVNDDLFPDNTGSFTVTVSSSAGVSKTCWPGHGYGDKNHEHCGPPGLVGKPTPGNSGPPGTHGKSDQHNNTETSSESQGSGGSNGDGGTNGNSGSNGKGHKP